MRALVGGLVLLLVAAATPVAADHSPGCPYLSYEPHVGPVTVMWDELYSNDHVVAFFVYAETNGENGWQRHDVYCGEEGDSDTLVFGVLWKMGEAPVFDSHVLP